MLELTVVGHIGQDAKIQNSNGNDFVAFSVAHSTPEEVDKETGEVLRKKTTYWVSITTRQLNLAPYLKKGGQVLVRGNMKLRPYKDETTGEKKMGINLSANLIQLLGKKENQANTPEEEKEPEFLTNGYEYVD